MREHDRDLSQEIAKHCDIIRHLNTERDAMKGRLTQEIAVLKATIARLNNAMNKTEGDCAAFKKLLFDKVIPTKEFGDLKTKSKSELIDIIIDLKRVSKYNKLLEVRL